MTVSMQRTLVALNLPLSTAKLLRLAEVIVEKMTDNEWFPSPSPSLAKVTAASQALESAEVDRLSGTKGKAAVRNAKRSALWSLLTRLKAYVQGVADDNPEHAASIIEGAGMDVKQKTPPKKPPFEVKPGPVSGSVRLVVRAVAKEAFYEWGVSTDGGKTWTSRGKTAQTQKILKDLPVGETCSFRFRATTRRGQGDWCAPVAFLVR